MSFNLRGGFGGSRTNASGAQRGANLMTSVRISFDEMVKGCEKEISLTLKEECPTCKGSGAKPRTQKETCKKCGGTGKITYTSQSIFGTMRNVQSCPDCGGTGQTVKEKCPDCKGLGYKNVRKTLKVVIPAGIESGQQVRLAGKGEPGVNGGARGDLLVEVIVSQSSRFERDGMDVYTEEKISFPTAALGGTIRVEIPEEWHELPYEEFLGQVIRLAAAAHYGFTVEYLLSKDGLKEFFGYGE